MTRARDLSKILPNIETSGNFSVTGVSTVGLVTFTENVNFGDNDILSLGDDNDLQIYHDGSNSYIEESNNELRIRGTTVRITNSGGTENYADFNDNGSVDLFYDNSKKFETTNDGIEVIGIATVGTGLTLSSDFIHLTDNAKINLGISSDLQIYHDGNHSRVADSGTGMLILQSDNGTGVLINKGTTENMAMFNVDGSVELYHDNSKKFETTGAGATVTGDLNVTGFSTSLKTVTNSIIQKGSQWLTGETASLAWNNGSGNVAITTALLGGNVTFQVTGIPTGLSHANNVITLSVVIHQAAAARIVNVVTFNGENKVIHWSGSAAPTPNANKMDVFNFVGIDTRGTGAIADYFLIGNMNGNYGV